MSRVVIANTLIVLLLIAVGVVSYGAYSVKEEAPALYTNRIPQQIGRWKGMQDFPFEDRIYKILETRDVLSRNYRHPLHGAANLIVVYSLWNRKVVHPPEVCLRGAGWQETFKDRVPLTGDALQQAHRIVLTKAPQQQVVLYWYKVGPYYTTSYVKHQLMTVWDTVRRRTAGMALVRVTVPVAPTESYETATERARDFALAVAPVLNEELP